MHVEPEETSGKKPNSREWAQGLSADAKLLVDTLKENGQLGTIIDCGAGEGRHSVYACRQGAQTVIAIEQDPAQIEILGAKKAKEQLVALVIRKGDALRCLGELPDHIADGIIDAGMSHYLIDTNSRQTFAGLVATRVKPGGLYSLTHFSEHEKLARGVYLATEEELRSLFPNNTWTEVLPLHEESWKRPDGKQHFAYKVVFRRISGYPER